MKKNNKGQLTLKRLKLADIKPYWNNPRKIDYAVEPVKESINDYGYIAPMIVDEKGVIIAGHTRYAALIKTDIKEIDVVIPDWLTEKQIQEYRILDNEVGELAVWDMDKYKEEFAQVK